jgi:hypothetical protein
MQIRTTKPMDGFESSEDEEGVGATTINSPDKEYDFRGRKSDDDSVASGDNSITWEKETMKIMKNFAEATALEEAKAEETVQEDAPVREIVEWDCLAENGDDEALMNLAPPPQPFETRRVVFKTTILKSLKAIALVLKASGYGTKQAIFNRLRDLPTVDKISDKEFEYQHPVEVGTDGVVRNKMET